MYLDGVKSYRSYESYSYVRYKVIEMLRILELIKDEATASLPNLEKSPQRHVTLAQVEEVAQPIPVANGTILSKQEFNIRFLLAVRCYIPKVAVDLVRQCREDIELFGLEYAQRKWAKFIEVKREGARQRRVIKE